MKNEAIRIKDDTDTDIAIVEFVGNDAVLPSEDQLADFYKRLLFLDDEVKKIWTIEKLYENIKLYVDEQKRLFVSEEKQTNSSVIKSADEREYENHIFDINYSLLVGDKQDIKELRKSAFDKKNVQTDARFLFGIHIVTRENDVKYGLSLISDAALKRNDRAAFILGWLNETRLMFSTINNNNNARKWYRESAERGYQPSIAKMIEMIKSGFYHVQNEKELNKWEARYQGVDEPEKDRLECIKRLLIETHK